MAAPTKAKEQLRVLEFYSGLGGLHYAAESALGSTGRVVEAFDINDTANDVYQHNFGRRPYQGNIEALTCRQLDRHGADMWLLSPPCQPYSRQGHQKQSRDARAASFITLLAKLPLLDKQPRCLLLENVVGFETSDTHADMLTTLHAAGYSTQGFILSPGQYGLPYSRPRYFCLAKKGRFAVTAPPSVSPGTQSSDGAAAPADPATPQAGTTMTHHVFSEPPYVLLDKAEGGAGQLTETPPLSHFLLQSPCPTADVPTPTPPTQALPLQPPLAAPCASTTQRHGTCMPGGSAPVICGSSAALVNGQGPASGPSLATVDTLPRTSSTNAGASDALGIAHATPDVEMTGAAVPAVQEIGAQDEELAGSHQPDSHKRAVPDSAGSQADGEDGGQPSSSKRSQPATGSLPSQQPASKPTCQQPATPALQQAGTTTICPTIHIHDPEPAVASNGATSGLSSARTGDTTQGSRVSCWAAFLVPDKAMAQSGDVLDVVTPMSSRCKTFTKNYSQFIKGTGSVICTAPEYQDPDLCTREAVYQRAVHRQDIPAGAGHADDRGAAQAAADVPGCAGADAPGKRMTAQVAADPASQGVQAAVEAEEQLEGAAPSAQGPGVRPLEGGSRHPLMPRLDKRLMATEWRCMNLRFFTPREVAVLHGLPPGFTFPVHLSLRARYQLLGNSLCVPVVADLIAYLLLEARKD